MYFISHRGNTLGPDISKENSVDYINDAIKKGYDVEIDVWFEKENFYLGHDKPTYLVDDVVHYCVPNISSRVSRTATFAISNILAPSLLKMGIQGGIEEYMKKEDGFRAGIYLYRGMLTNAILGSMFELPYKDLNLII